MNQHVLTISGVAVGDQSIWLITAHAQILQNDLNFPEWSQYPTGQPDVDYVTRPCRQSRANLKFNPACLIIKINRRIKGKNQKYCKNPKSFFQNINQGFFPLTLKPDSVNLNIRFLAFQILKVYELLKAHNF